MQNGWLKVRYRFIVVCGGELAGADAILQLRYMPMQLRSYREHDGTGSKELGGQVMEERERLVLNRVFWIGRLRQVV